MTEWIALLVTIAFFELIGIIVATVAWKEERKKRINSEITSNLREQEIFNKVAIQFDTIGEKIDSVINKGRSFLVDDYRENLSIADLTGRSHHVMCLIDDEIEAYLYAYIDSLSRGSGDNSYDKRSHLEQIIRQFVFVPVPSKKGNVSMMSVMFDQLNYATTTTPGKWVAKVWGIEFSSYDNKRTQHLVYLDKIPALGNDTLPIPYHIYQVSWYHIFPEDWYIFNSIDELTSFFEELHNEDKVLRRVIESHAVYKELLLPSIKGFVFDPKWLAERNNELELEEELKSYNFKPLMEYINSIYRGRNEIRLPLEQSVCSNIFNMIKGAVGAERMGNVLNVEPQYLNGDNVSPETLNHLMITFKIPCRFRNKILPIVDSKVRELWIIDVSERSE